MEEFATSIATVVAALIAGAIAFITTVLTKENKTSEFRQAWIDALRRDISAFCGLIHHISNSYCNSKEQDPNFDEHQWWKDHAGVLTRGNTILNRIVLRLNPAEHQAMLQMLNNLSHGLAQRPGDERNAAVDRLVQETQRVLKFEWNRVKRGEPIYQRTKWVSLGLIGLGALLGAGYLFFSLFR